MSVAVAVHWLLHPAKKRWHAWRHGERQSVCGTLNVEHLRQYPAGRVLETLGAAELEMACGTCKRLALVEVVQSSGTAADQWLGFIRRHLKRVHATAPRADLEAVAALLVEEAGPPDDEKARELFDQVRVLLLTPMRVRTASGKDVRRLVGLKDALTKLPPRSGSLRMVASALRCWRHVMGKMDPGHFRPDRVIEVMLQVPDAEAYLKHLKARGLEPLGVVFHENVLARARKEPSLRGLFGSSSEYWKQTEDQLNVVSD